MSQQQGYKRSWRNLLLNSRYQLRFTLFMVALCAVLMAALGWKVMGEAKNTTKVAKINIQTITDSTAPVLEITGTEEELTRFMTAQEARKRDVARDERNIFIALIVTGVLLSCGLFVYGIKMTHKVAGPLFKVTTYFDKVKNGKFDKVYNLRKGDQLQNFYEHFKEAHGALRKRQELDVERLRDVIASAEKADLGGSSPAVASALEDLRQLLKTKEASLG